MVIDASGNALAVWVQYDSGRYNIWASRYTEGSGWGTAQSLENDTAGDAGYPQVAMDANGNALAVWEQSDGTHYNIRANRYTPGGGWSTAERLGNNSSGNASHPQVAMEASGNALVVWQHSDGARYNIWASRFE